MRNFQPALTTSQQIRKRSRRNGPERRARFRADHQPGAPSLRPFPGAKARKPRILTLPKPMRISFHQPAYNYPPSAHNRLMVSFALCGTKRNRGARSYQLDANSWKLERTPLTPLLPVICAQRPQNHVFTAQPSPYPIETKLLPCRDRTLGGYPHVSRMSPHHAQRRRMPLTALQGTILCYYHFHSQSRAKVPPPHQTNRSSSQTSRSPRCPSGARHPDH